MRKGHLLLYRIDDRYDPDFWKEIDKFYRLSHAGNLKKAVTALTAEHFVCIVAAGRYVTWDELRYFRGNFQTVPIIVYEGRKTQAGNDDNELPEELQGSSIQWLPKGNCSRLLEAISVLVGQSTCGADLSVFGLTAEHYPARVKKALALIQQGFRCKELSVGKIALELNVHRCHFEREFNEHCKISPKQLIIGLRMLCAFRLMKNEGMKLLHIAQLAGFTDYYQFCKLFHKHMGASPSEFRKAFSEGDFAHHFIASSTKRKMNETKPQQISQ